MYRHATLVSLSLLASAACTPVGEPAPPAPAGSKIDVYELHSAGITPTSASSCVDSDGSATLRFTMRGVLDREQDFDEDEGLLIITETIGYISQQTFDDANDSFPEDAIRFENTTVFETPDVPCEAGTCSLEGAVCAAPPNASSDQGSERCHVSDDEALTTAGAPVFVSKTGTTQLFGVMLEATESWEGTLPRSITDLNPDFDGDGLGDFGASLNLQASARERATDPNELRMQLIGQFIGEWQSLKSDPRHQIQLGLWTFGASGATARSEIAALGSTPDDAVFTSSQEVAFEALNETSDTFSNVTDTEQAAVYESLITVLESTDGYASPQHADAEKILTIIVDGPDELRLPELDAERVIAAAKAVDARIFIVHVDPAVQTRGTNTTTGDDIPLFPDDPDYVLSQGEGFASEADCDCKNFEVCRTVTQYSYQPGSNTEIPAPANADRLYCVRDRDASGRVGPVADYEQIACATGGGYLYVPDVDDLSDRAGWLPTTAVGLWELPVTVNVPGSGTGEPTPYLLESDITLTLGTNDFTFSHGVGPQGFSPNGPRVVLFSE